MIKKISKAIQSLELAVFSLMVPYGEYIQYRVMAGEKPYTWTVGHLTDIGYAGGLTTVAMFVTGSSEKAKAKMALGIPTAMSALEVITSLHHRIGFDWQDIACYYGAAAFSYGLNKALGLFNRKDE